MRKQKEMANLMSELERFEQEMKELGSETSKLLPPPPLRVVLRAPLHPPLPPPPPPPISGLPASSTHTAQLVVPPPPPPPPPRIPSAGTLVTPPPPPPPGPWVNGSTSATSPAVIVAQPKKPTPPPPPIIAPPQYSYSATSVTTAYTPAPPPPPPPPSAVASSYFPAPFHLQQHQRQYQAPPRQYNPVSQTIHQSQPQTPLQKSHSSVSTAQYQYSTLYQQSAPGVMTRVIEHTIYRVPHQQQAQQLFQRDAQTITPEALESVKAALASGEGEQKAETKRKVIPRKAAGQSWEDPTLADWPENDHRLFCGDLGNEVNDEVLTKSFSRFISFNMARVIRDKRTGKTKGYGFVSFANPSDLALALREMNGKYVGNRPIKLRKSTWKERTDVEALQNSRVNLKHIKRPKTSKKSILHK